MTCAEMQRENLKTYLPGHAQHVETSEHNIRRHQKNCWLEVVDEDDRPIGSSSNVQKWRFWQKAMKVPPVGTRTAVQKTVSWKRDG